MIEDLINRPCTIVRRSGGAEDAYGNIIPVETTEETVFELQERQRTELQAQGEVAKSDWLGVFLAETDLDSSDSVVDNETGQEFELVGQPWPVRDPLTQEESHVEASLQRVAGSGDAS